MRRRVIYVLNHIHEKWSLWNKWNSIAMHITVCLWVLLNSIKINFHWFDLMFIVSEKCYSNTISFMMNRQIKCAEQLIFTWKIGVLGCQLERNCRRNLICNENFASLQFSIELWTLLIRLVGKYQFPRKCSRNSIHFHFWISKLVVFNMIRNFCIFLVFHWFVIRFEEKKNQKSIHNLNYFQWLLCFKSQYINPNLLNQWIIAEFVFTNWK